MDPKLRIDALKEQSVASNIEFFLITDIKNVYYFTGFLDISDATICLIIPSGATPLLLTYPLSYELALEKAGGCTVKSVESGKISEQIINKAVSLNVKKAYFDKLDFPTYLKLRDKGIDVNQDGDMIWKLRRIKDADEIELMRKAAKLADIGMQAGLEAVKVGVFEYEIAAEVEYAMRKGGSEGTAFETVVASGPRSAFPHGLCSDRRIQGGDFVTLDLGAVHKGYRSDITRTTIAGKASKRKKELFNLVLKAQEEAFHHIRPGIVGKEVDNVARKIIDDGGYGKMFVHGLGHGVGLDIHEPPRLSPRSNDVLEAGNMVTDEPGVYIKGFGGVRIEDLIHVLADGGERLTKTPRGLEV